MTAEKFPEPQLSTAFDSRKPSFPQPTPQTSQYSGRPVAIPSPAYFSPSQVEDNNVSFPQPSPHPQMSLPQGHGPDQGLHGQTFSSETHTHIEMKANLPCCCPCGLCAGCCAAICCIPCCLC